MTNAPLTASNPPHILVVDDTPANLYLLGRLLRTEGYRISSVPDGAAALRLLDRHAPDLILLDIRMPGMDGFAVAAAVKADPRHAEIPLLFISVFDDPESRVKAFAAGGVDFIGKPFFAPELLARVRTHLELQHSRRLLTGTCDDLSRKLQQGEDLFRSVFENANAGMALLNPNGRFLQVNPALCQMLGYPTAELTGRSAMEITEPADRAATRSFIQRALAGAEPRMEMEKRYLRKDGRTIWTHLAATLIRDAKQRAQYFVVHVVDIEARKKAEQRSALNEQRLDALLSLSRNAAAMDEEQIFKAGLEDAERLTGSQAGYLHFVEDNQSTINMGFWSAATLTHCTAGPQLHYPVQDAGIWADSIRLKRPIIHNEYAQTGPHQGLPEGHIAMRRHMSALAFEHGRITMILGVGNKAEPYDESDLRQLQLIADELWRIVSRRRTELALEQARLEAEAASRAKSIFLSAMSHELRTPLNGIRGHSATLARSAALGATQRQALQSIDTSTAQLLRMINEVLEFTDLESGVLHASPRRQPLPGLLAALERQFRPRAMRHGLQWRMQAATLPDSILADGNLLLRVLEELLDNAIKFSVQGQVGLEIAAAPKGRHKVDLTFRILDQGPGIQPSDLEAVFTPFNTPQGGRWTEGVGLGLSLCRQLARQMGGELGLASRVPDGPWVAAAEDTLADLAPPAEQRQGTLARLRLRTPAPPDTQWRQPQFTAVPARAEPPVHAEPPASIMQRLQRLSEAGDVQALCAEAAALEGDFPAFAQTLIELATSMQLDELEQWLKHPC